MRLKLAEVVEIVAMSCTALYRLGASEDSGSGARRDSPGNDPLSYLIFVDPRLRQNLVTPPVLIFFPVGR